MVEFLTDPQNLISMLVGVLVFATLFTLLNGMAGGAKLDDRMKAVATRRDELRRRSRQAIGTGSTGLRHTDEGFKKRVVDRLNLTTVLRARRMMGEKIKALSSEAMASAGIIGSLPPVVMTLVFITTPAYMMLLFTDPRGQVMLLGAAIWMASGIFVMKLMIAFKF